jgi:hypothetical protein
LIFFYKPFPVSESILISEVVLKGFCGSLTNPRNGHKG